MSPHKVKIIRKKLFLSTKQFQHDLMMVNYAIFTHTLKACTNLNCNTSPPPHMIKCPYTFQHEAYPSFMQISVFQL